MFRFIALVVVALILIGCSTSQQYSNSPPSVSSELCMANTGRSEVFQDGDKFIAEYYDRRSQKYFSYPVIATGEYDYSESRQREYELKGQGDQAPHYRRGDIKISADTDNGKCFVPLLSVVGEIYQLPRSTSWYGVDREGKAFGNATVKPRLSFTLYDPSTKTAFLSSTIHTTFSRLYRSTNGYTEAEVGDMSTALAKLKASQISVAKAESARLEAEKQERIRVQREREKKYLSWQNKSRRYINSLAKGSLVCTYGPLYYHSAFNGFQKGESDGYLVASVEDISADRHRVKVLIDGLWPGFEGKKDLITGTPKVGAVPVNRGTVLWDDIGNWGVCDY
ncbi:YqkE family protein [Spongiibacter sp.]|uniref:YqkE family protein n=1 Tax=Spongiibacter sp. TaxID=2024860 RepID=UPI000C3EE959|nr:YqkE family protein [Spongiibacter sp.]MAY37858.1 hypothetical protein [Spongiibacter sp.]|tara:strand:+ start:571 stop:1581 length:1011 start_codon:yes stop_codon:yes gene_type:complete